MGITTTVLRPLAYEPTAWREWHVRPSAGVLGRFGTHRVEGRQIVSGGPFSRVCYWSSSPAIGCYLIGRCVLRCRLLLCAAGCYDVGWRDGAATRAGR